MIARVRLSNRDESPPLAKGGPGGVAPALPNTVITEAIPASIALSSRYRPNDPRAAHDVPGSQPSPPLAPPSQGGERFPCDGNVDEPNFLPLAAPSKGGERHRPPRDRWHRTRNNRSGRLAARRSGFTLVELLVVVLIVLIVSAAALPVVIPAISHRQVSEAARILQGALVGAHDTAVHNAAPAGIRLLADPSFNGINQNPSSPFFGQLDASLPLAANRIIPIEPAPDYSEGMVSIVQDLPAASPFPNGQNFYPYPAFNSTTSSGQSVINGVLMLEECPGYWVQPNPVGNPNNYVFVPNEPTSWFWNIRIGEKIQIGNSGQTYTIVGPLSITANTGGNPELFVNDGRRALLRSSPGRI